MGYKMKGHTLPGINQRSDAKKHMHCGRADSAAFQMKASALKDDKLLYIQTKKHKEKVPHDENNEHIE